jgi:hypothetical protein
MHTFVRFLPKARKRSIQAAHFAVSGVGANTARLILSSMGHQLWNKQFWKKMFIYFKVLKELVRKPPKGLLLN